MGFAMRARFSELVLAAALTACVESHEPCPSAPVSCRARAPSEWAAAPTGARLVPERAEYLRELDVVEGTFLVLSADGSASRVTFRVGLSAGRVSIFGLEPLGNEWARARMDALDLSGELASLVVCAPLPDGGELRLVPSRETMDPPPEGEFFGSTPIASAMRRTDAAGNVRATYDAWIPSLSSLSAWYCANALVALETGEHSLRCGYFNPCNGTCLPAGTYSCTAELIDGLSLCQPP
jgi:hypothetical protein